MASNDPQVIIVDKMGPPGIGIPIGGSDGFILAKASSADYDAEWIDPSSDIVLWGGIGGTLANQTDLQAALDAKALAATTITTTAPITGGGDLSANRTFAIHVADASHDGYLSSANWSTFNSKESALTFSNSVSRSVNTITLTNDSATPGNSKYYGTDGSGTKGFFSISSAAGVVNTIGITTANGVSGSSSGGADPRLTVTLGAITPSTVTIGAGSAITSSGAGGALGTNAFTSTAYVPTSTTVNGHALSSNVTVTPTDLSLVIGTNTEAWSATLDTLATGDGSVLTVPATSISTLLNRNQIDFTPTTVTEASTITIAQGVISQTTASGTLTTIAFGTGQTASQPITILRILVTSGPYTITIPTSFRITDAGSTTSLTLATGNHEISWVYDGTKYWMTDSTVEVTVTPTALSGNVNNYSPTGLATAATLRIDGGSSDRNITGLDSSAAADGRVLRIVNIGSTNNLTLVNQSGSSSAANRFLLPADTILPVNTALSLVYDATSTAWRPWSRALSNTGVTAGSYTHSSITVDSAGRVTAASSGSVTTVATDPIFTAKGDLAIGTGSATAAKLSVGSNGTILTADSTQTTGQKWTTATYPATAGTAGKVLVSDGTNIVSSTPTFPNASATSGKTIRSDGTNWIASTATLSDSPSTAGKVLVSDGTNWITSTPTFPNSSATSGKIIKSDGTNWVASTETYAAPGTSGNVLTSDGTNWTSAAATGGAHGVYAGASPPTTDVGPFAIAITGVDLKTAGTTTVFTVPTSRRFLCTGSEAWVTSVTSGGAGQMTFQIKESSASNIMTNNTASGSGTPQVNKTVYTQTPTTAGGPYFTCNAGDNVQVVVSTSNAGSTAVSGTVIVRGYYVA